jgi:hypothetical protein
LTILAVGSLIFLWHFSRAGVSGTGDRTLLEIWALSRRLTLVAHYVVFAVLVMGPGVLVRKRDEQADAEPSS